MEVKYQLQIRVVNYDNYNHTYNKEVTLKDVTKFANLLAIIKKNIDKTNWNWFSNGLPDKWDGNRFVLDTWMLKTKMKENFDYDIEDINLVKEFFLRFTPNGGDRIDNIKLFKVEEIEIA